MNILDTIKNMEVATPTLRAIAEVLEVPQQRLYSVAKQPKAGEIYDAKVYNWDAISRFIEKRLGAGQAFETAEELIQAALDADAAFATTDHRRGPRTGGVASSKNTITVGDKQVPERKYDPEVGDEIMFKKDPILYSVVFKTPLGIVMKESDNDKLMCLSNWTFNQKALSALQVVEAKAAKG